MSGPACIAVLADTSDAEYHVGDEAMLEANLAVLEGAGLDAQVLGRGASGAELEAACEACDAVWISGGGNLCDTWPALVDQRLTLLSSARRRGRPAILTGQTIGPALTLRRSELAEELGGARLVGVRERSSLALVRDLGVPEARIAFQPDDAFDLAETPPSDPALADATSGPYLGVTIDGSLGADEAFVAAVAPQLARLARETGLPVVLVPHVGPLGAAGGEDAVAVEGLAAYLRLQGVRPYLAGVRTAREAVWLAAHAALTISSRYHPLVFATAAGAPCLGIARDDYTRAKLRGALDHVDAGEWCLEATGARRGGLLPMARARLGTPAGAGAGAARALRAAEPRRLERVLRALSAAAAPGEAA